MVTDSGVAYCRTKTEVIADNRQQAHRAQEVKLLTKPGRLVIIFAHISNCSRIKCHETYGRCCTASATSVSTMSRSSATTRRCMNFGVIQP